MGTPSQHFFEDYVDLQNTYPLGEEGDEDDQGQYQAYYSAVGDGYPPTNPWQPTPDLMGAGPGYLNPYSEDGKIDGYDVPDAHTESMTPGTQTSGQASSDTWSHQATRGKLTKSSKSSNTSAPSTDSGSASSLKHKKGKHHISSSSYHHRGHGDSSDKTGGGGSGSSKDKGKDKGGKDKGAKDKGGKDKGPKDRRGKEMDKDKDKSGDVKRDKFLERNRVAASKCRQKKKEWVNDLEDQKFGLESRNSHLQMEYNGLLGEVSRMKDQIMAHANCKDRNIDKWIENEARRFVQTTSERYDREQRRYPSVPGSAGGASMYPMEAPTPSYASSSYQNDDGASQLSPTDMGFSHDGSVYAESPVESRHHRPSHGERKGSGHSHR